MTDITINGTTYSVDIQHTVYTGYSGGLANVDGANRLPTFTVIANVNGASTTIDISFAGHHVINYATVTNANNVNFLSAIGFDGLSYNSNVIPLPNFAPGSRSDERVGRVRRSFSAVTRRTEFDACPMQRFALSRRVTAHRGA